MNHRVYIVCYPCDVTKNDDDDDDDDDDDKTAEYA